jgi:diguanylate cyclase (GGDEF)-like protein
MGSVKGAHMRDQPEAKPESSDRPRERAPISLVIACAMLWIGGAVAVFGLHGPALIALGFAGGGLTLSLLVVVHLQHSRLHGLATTDALTGLANHRAFHDQLVDALARGERERRAVALVLLDLDDFKDVNDTHGHPYGDEVLREVGRKLADSVRGDDVAARTGGEEFGLILPGVDAARAADIAERARKAVATVPMDGRVLSFSAGIATYPSDSDNASDLYQLADTALYWAKRGGKRRTRRFDPGHSPADWSERQQAAVEAVLASDEPVRVVYQPVVALATGQLVGYEALARFPDESGRSPDVWFAQAHGCGLGAELEAAAISAALKPIGRPPGTHLALNISPSALSSEQVQRALPDDLSELVIEITEHEYVPDDDVLAATIADLRARGAMVAVDDAGAGHAGLKQLMRVRPDIVKLDRDLAYEIHHDAARMALVESFARFAREVGAAVCGEGIETLDDLAALADLDIQWGQGYALGRPGPPWVEVPHVAADVCRSTLADALRGGSTRRQPIAASNLGLVSLSRRLAAARSRGDVEAALRIIAGELGASSIAISRWHPGHGAIETLAEQGEAPVPARSAVPDYPATARVLHDHEAVQVVLSDPDSDPAETELLLAHGQRSLLMVPVVSHGESLGLLEAYSRNDRPWSRREITLARVVANQLAAVGERMFSVPAARP